VGVAPPFAGVAVKITFDPEQIEVALAPILTDGITVGLTVIVIVFDVAAGVVTQESEDVITTETWSPFAREAFW
jgi:hypothetical protein